MKIFILILSICNSVLCIAEETNISIESENEVEVYKIEKQTNDESISLFPSNKNQLADMTIIGKTPIELKLNNGNYLFNIGGNQKYNKNFQILASGNDVQVTIKGDFEKANKDSIWVMGLGLGCVFSLTTVKLITDQVPVDKGYLAYVLPISLGCGFSFYFGKWIHDLPKVKIQYLSN
jgi:hypothetical protein